MTTADHDEQLATLLARMTDELRRGQIPDIDRTTQEHPGLARDLRELWTAVLVAEGIAAGRKSENAELRMRNAELLVGGFRDDGTPATLAASEITPGDASAGRLPRLFGDYELLAELGRGGMGIVYKARQLSLNRVVALKMVLGGELASPANLARFEAEAQAVARLDHPQIVPVYEVGQHAGQPYFAMRYVSGRTLAQLLSTGPLSAREAAELLLPVCHAIHYAHRQGVLHRDIKPSNILIDRDGRPHVTDFGLAKQVDAAKRADGGPQVDVAKPPDIAAQLTMSGAIIGTPSYMAPEQVAGSRGKLSPASDVYSLGTILYQLLTGRPPFQAASPVDTMLLVLEQDPLPPRLLNPRANPELEMIALKCLQKPAELRYPTAAALAGDLAAFLADEPISARSGQFGQIVVRWFRETHHATVLENWGLLWMWHSLALLILSLLTNWLQWRGEQSPWPYLGLWVAGLGTWAAIFWALRRRAGPVTFVERQIAHVWASSMVSIAMLFLVEMILGLPVLTLSPILAISSGMIFLVKAGMLTGRFYVQAAALFATAAAMAWLQRIGQPWGITLFGVVSAACFFFPGLKYYRQRLRGRGE